MRILFALAVGLAAIVSTLGTAGTAAAQGISIGPGGIHVDPGVPRPRGRDGIGRREATAVAQDSGMAEVESVERREDVYIVRGFSRRGERMRVVVDAYSGQVVRVVRRE
jgi:hypothetical protein